MANKTNSMAHTKWMYKYHIVFTPKYRRKAIYNQCKESIKDSIKRLCSYKGVEIIEGHLIPYPYACEYPVKDECIKFYGISERKECPDDI